jgi:23S rRNA (adenine2503-C2)-methyltransferase
MKPDPTILDLTPAEARERLAAWLAGAGEPRYRVNQVLPRLWERPVARWADATDLPLELRARLDEAFPLPRMVLDTQQCSSDGTLKYLWRLPDGEAIESVWIPQAERKTLCISSQAGCALGCVFCATGRMGFRRNLSPWEIAGQVREMALMDAAAPPTTKQDAEQRTQLRPTNVVYMGMGEPLLNWDAVDVSLSILNDPHGMGIGARHITVSTVGILPAMAKLAKRTEQFRLAISLHAPTSPRRSALMPIERKYPLPEVLAALGAFRRRVTFEYVLIRGANDSDADADALSRIARPLGALVNLLPLHPGGAPGLEPVAGRRMQEFAGRLRLRGVETVLRRSRGLDISAACGQLRVERGGPDAPDAPGGPGEPANVPLAAGVALGEPLGEAAG